MEREFDILFLIEEGIVGTPIYDRWNKLRWYQKLWGEIFPKYKEKFIDVKGFETNYEGNGCYNVDLGKSIGIFPKT